MKKFKVLGVYLLCLCIGCGVISCSKDGNNTIPEEEEPGDDSAPVGTVYLEEDFEKMIWGGDYINQQVGVIGVFGRDADNRYIIDENEPIREAGINTDGCPDFFSQVSEAYKTLRGINGWEGGKVYERPGYLKIGTSASRDAFIRTAPLEEIGEGQVNVRVSVDLAIWGGSSETLLVHARDGGISSVTQLQVSTTSNWTTREFTILNATKDTKIEIQSDPTQVGRFFLSSIKVTRSE